MNRNVVYLITVLHLSTHFNLLEGARRLSFFERTTTSVTTAAKLNKRYEDERMICEYVDDYGHYRTRPSYECSGILIRGINPALKLPHFWSVKASSQQKESLSYAFLRQDAKWTHFPRGYVSGFIMYPHLDTPKGKDSQSVYCAFPLNASTDQRGGRHGCGTSSAWYVGEESKNCHEIGVNDFNSWKEQFTKYAGRRPRNYYAHQCAFDMTRREAAGQFKVVLEASKFLEKHPTHGYKNNELLIRSWGDHNVTTLPIEAIFYLDGSRTGENRALAYQEDFRKESGGELVPIVKIKMPTRTTTFRAEPHS